MLNHYPTLHGDTVKIDVEKICGRGEVLNTFRTFLSENEDKEFTAQLADGYKHMYTLLEDTSEIGWLFHFDDLIVIKEA